MQIKHRLLTAGEKPSEIKLTGRIINLDGRDYDLDNLNEKPVAETDDTGAITNQEEIDDFTDAVYIENGEKILFVIVDGPANEDHPEYQDRQFFFINNNALNLFDLNSNGVIEEGEELERFVEIWNTSWDDRREYLKERLGKK